MNQMKRSSLFIIAICLLAILVGSFAFRNQLFQHSSPARDIDAKGFAVVELFTSEGCSSCPPADQLVARTLEEDKDKQVYILSYHVDYWDRLGWKDRFSDAEFTERQQHYAELLHLNSVYTPQIIVNGRNEFVGSNKVALDKALSGSLKDSPKESLSIGQIISDGKINLTYETTADKNVDLVINLVQKSARTSVKGGENSGRELSHVQVVRKQIVQTIAATKGKASLDLPTDYKANEWELICYIQNSNTGEVLCAARTEFAN